MLYSLLHAGYKKAIAARLSGSGEGLVVPDGGRTARVFNQALFMVFGRLARLDGQVTPDAIDHTTRVMGLLGLDPVARQLAIDYFNQGKEPAAPINESTETLMRFIGRRSDLTRLFLKTLGDAAGLDGGIGLQQRILLRNVAEICGFSKPEFEKICLHRIPYGEYYGNGLSPRVSNAYQVLQLSPGAGKREIKRAYLRLVSRHHPDKLNLADTSREANQAAHDQFTSIQEAYEILCGTLKQRA
jgi:DnaJ like chaperone protein